MRQSRSGQLPGSPLPLQETEWQMERSLTESPIQTLTMISEGRSHTAAICWGKKSQAVDDVNVILFMVLGEKKLYWVLITVDISLTPHQQHVFTQELYPWLPLTHGVHSFDCTHPSDQTVLERPSLSFVHYITYWVSQSDQKASITGNHTLGHTSTWDHNIWQYSQSPAIISLIPRPVSLGMRRSWATYTHETGLGYTPSII